jgi:hypothetical protein
MFKTWCGVSESRLNQRPAQSPAGMCSLPIQISVIGRFKDAFV